MKNLPEQLTETIGNAVFKNAIFEGYMAIFEGKGLVCRIIDGARDSLVRNEHMPKELANAAVLKTRQLFFDPLATPGSKPVTDPEFKRYLPLFPYCAEMMVHQFKFGTDRYMREDAEDFAARFTEYMKEHYRDSLPQIRFNSDFDRLAREISGNLKSYRPDPDSYGVIPVATREELQKYVGKYGLDDWCIVHSDDDWNKFTMPGFGRFYLVVRDDADRTFDRYGVVGIVVNQYGRVEYAFDRANHVVDKESLREIVEYHSLDRQKAQGFGAALDMLNRRDDMDVGEVFPYAKQLTHSAEYYIVGFPDRHEYCILARAYDSASCVSDVYDEIQKLDGYDDLYLCGNGDLFSLASESVIYRAPGGFMMRYDCPGIECSDLNLVPLYRDWHDRHPVNFVSVNDKDKSMLLSPGNSIPVEDIEFRTRNTVEEVNPWTHQASTHGKPATVDGMSDGDYWEVTAGGRVYIVNRPGMRLEEAGGIEDRSGNGYTTLLTDTGYYSLTVPEGPGKVRYLMKDGKKVFDRGFSEIDSTGETEYDIALKDMDGKWYEYSTRTGDMREY